MDTPRQPKQCPRCHRVFACKPDDITNCQCSAITLTPAERIFIQSHYDDCICSSCLQAIKQELQQSPTT